MEQLVLQAAWQAKKGIFNGTLETRRDRRYFEDCRWWHPETGTNLWFTRDAGTHTSGFLKNPYDRCLHLSLAFFSAENMEPRGLDRALTREWVQMFFKEWERGVVCEGPSSPDGRRIGVWHYRLFCSPAWIPCVPLGDVYSTSYTEAGWVSWSDRKHALMKEDADAAMSGEAHQGR